MTEPTKPADPETTELDTSKLKTPDEDASKEPTPIGDQVEKDLADGKIPFVADSVEDDVQTALARKTQDGKGDEDPGESDWNGYATDEVETD